MVTVSVAVIAPAERSQAPETLTKKKDNMVYLIKFLRTEGTVTGPPNSPQVQGLYLKSYDPDAYEGRGDAEGTDDIEEALTFKTPEEALEFWQQPSTVKPLREDGKPNRPLTTFSIEVVMRVKKVDPNRIHPKRLEEMLKEDPT
jgi:hypothetical protein